MFIFLSLFCERERACIGRGLPSDPRVLKLPFDPAPLVPLGTWANNASSCLDLAAGESVLGAFIGVVEACSPPLLGGCDGSPPLGGTGDLGAGSYGTYCVSDSGTTPL